MEEMRVGGLELFSGEDAADLPDDLHPTPAGYQRMGERFYRRIFSDGGLWEKQINRRSAQ